MSRIGLFPDSLYALRTGPPS
ncbi:hypothetical protein EMIT0158MI4_150062 [Burkholderia ambifaria]